VVPSHGGLVPAFAPGSRNLAAILFLQFQECFQLVANQASIVAILGAFAQRPPAPLVYDRVSIPLASRSFTSREVRMNRLPAWHKDFLRMLPTIRQVAHVSFRHLHGDAYDDAVEEVIANACVAYKRLVDLGKTDVAYPTVLARFAVAQQNDGRRVGTRQCVRDVLSPPSRKKERIVVERLDRFDDEEGEWVEAVVEDYRTPVAEQAAFRCDFPAWLGGQPKPKRRIAEALAVGLRNQEVARMFRLSRGRISQLRREFFDSWREFHGEVGAEVGAAPCRKRQVGEYVLSPPDRSTLDRIPMLEGTGNAPQR